MSTSCFNSNFPVSERTSFRSFSLPIYYFSQHVSTFLRLLILIHFFFAVSRPLGLCDQLSLIRSRTSSCHHYSKQKIFSALLYLSLVCNHRGDIIWQSLWDCGDCSNHKSTLPLIWDKYSIHVGQPCVLSHVWSRKQSLLRMVSQLTLTE